MSQLTIADLSRLAAYVDDALPADERAQFEADLAANPALREELELQSGLDASLNRLFEYSEAARSQPAPAAAPPSAFRFPLSRLGPIAAAILIAATAAWYFTRKDPNLIPPQQVWANMERANFVPNWRCENEQIFRDYLKTRLGESFTIDESDALKVVGWGYSSDYQFYPLSKHTLTLINQVGPEHAVVLIDRAENDRTLNVPESSGLHLFKQRQGNLVLYEISPLPEPHVLPHVRS